MKHVRETAAAVDRVDTRRMMHVWNVFTKLVFKQVNKSNTLMRPPIASVTPTIHIPTKSKRSSPP